MASSFSVTDSGCRQFNADPSVIGRTLTVDGAPCTIVGVLADSFKFFRVLNRELDIWRPLVADPTDREHTINLHGRLAATASLASARAELAAAFAALPAEGFRAGSTTDVGLMSRRWTATQRPILLALEAAVALVICIAAANVANLVLAIAAGRRKGPGDSGRARSDTVQLAAVLLREMLIVAGSGAGIGLLLAFWIVDVMNGAVSYQDIDRLEPFRVDLPVIGLTSALALVSALLFALLPSRSATHADIVEPLKDGTPGSTLGPSYRYCAAYSSSRSLRCRLRSSPPPWSSRAAHGR